MRRKIFAVTASTLLAAGVVGVATAATAGASEHTEQGNPCAEAYVEAVHAANYHWQHARRDALHVFLASPAPRNHAAAVKNAAFQHAQAERQHALAQARAEFKCCMEQWKETR